MSWTKTGDYLDLLPVDGAFAHFFVGVTDKMNSRWSLTTVSSDARRRLETPLVLEQLQSAINQINEACAKLKIPLQITDKFNYAEQSHLNQLHSEWVSMIKTYHGIEFLFDKYKKDLSKQFHNINTLVHLLEQGFSYRLRDSTFWQHENVFANQLQPWGLFHVSLKYADFGRCGFEKFVSNCYSVNDAELVNWDTICPVIDIFLCRPYTTEIPREYLEFCKMHSIVPHSQQWPLGNIHNWQDNLTNARTVMERNINLSENYIVFEIKS